MRKIQYILSSLLLALLVVSCVQDVEMEGNQGYLVLSINSLTSTHAPGETRAAVPDDYDAKTLHVEILDEDGTVIKSTNVIVPMIPTVFFMFFIFPNSFLITIL